MCFFFFDVEVHRAYAEKLLNKKKKILSKQEQPTTMMWLVHWSVVQWILSHLKVDPDLCWLREAAERSSALLIPAEQPRSVLLLGGQPPGPRQTTEDSDKRLLIDIHARKYTSEQPAKQVRSLSLNELHFCMCRAFAVSGRRSDVVREGQMRMWKR